MITRDRFAGVIIGTAVGDALGLPRENMTGGRARKIFGETVEHRFFFGRGMVSDDTEHTCMCAQSLLEAGGDHRRFAALLARRFRWWLLACPAGAGLGTLRAILKLWLGVPAGRSGVRSAGNGPAMRSAIIGCVYHDDPARLAEFVRASTLITHSDPRAYEGAAAIAIAAAYACTREPDMIDVDELLGEIQAHVEGEHLLERLDQVRKSLHNDRSAKDFAAATGADRGVSGYINDTVPAALFCWLRNKSNFRGAIEDAVLLGGDTDTTGAIAGALAGAATGLSSVPQEWLDGLWEFPRTPTWMRTLAESLADRSQSASSEPMRAPRYFWPAIPFRNLFFLIVVLLHGFRRLLPPY